ncbi:MAG: DUF2279 domain-containing protein [Chitinophagaceae bacterium]|nr:DUF2279 domain-containing protein [Chitinophagaceae bacterium]
MLKRFVILLSLQPFILAAFAQDSTSSPTLNTKKLIIVTGANAAFYTGSFIALNKAWYDGYDRTGFHFFDDLPEWNQMDKAGHVWTTYHVSRASKEMWAWTGLNRKTSAILGGVSGMVYQSIIEIQDAYSAAWGFSWSDVGANVTGAGLFVLQELAGTGQNVVVKMTYWPKKYPSSLVDRRNELFGKSLMERVLKDYNSQTYWLSANLKSLFPDLNVPSWLNIAGGYGADGMYGGRTNEWVDKEGTRHDYTDIRRSRKFYFSPDIDLTRIPVRSKVLKKVFFVLNVIKVPAPAVVVETGKGLKFGIR